MVNQLSLVLLLLPTLSDACTFAWSGEPVPWDKIHQKARAGSSKGEKVTFIPDRLETKGNAFQTSSLLRTAKPVGGSKLLGDVLLEFASTQSEDMCYWSFQPLAPPKGQGKDSAHPYRHYWEVENGQYDEDLEWEAMLANVASARLKRIQTLSNGSLVSTMCSGGRDVAKRRCQNGKAKADSWQDHCMPQILEQELRWGMAITIWKIDSNLKNWVRYWRSNNSFGHTPNIQWTYRGGHEQTTPWNATIPPPTEINPEGVPHGPMQWPASQGQSWGSGSGEAMMAKVLPCSQVPQKFQYPKEQYYCDHVEEGASQTTADEAYGFWKEVTSLWPPTKKCTDNVTRLNEILGGQGSPTKYADCKEGMASLTKTIENFNCDAIIPGRYQIRDVCCSQCGNQPIPDLPEPPAPPPPPAGDVYRCGSCGHQYDAAEDGGGLAFEDLPDSWRCPICGLPKAAYRKASEDGSLMV